MLSHKLRTQDRPEWRRHIMAWFDEVLIFTLSKSILEQYVTNDFFLAGVQIWLEVSGHRPLHVSHEPWTLHSGWAKKDEMR